MCFLCRCWLMPQQRALASRLPLQRAAMIPVEYGRVLSSLTF